MKYITASLWAGALALGFSGVAHAGLQNGPFDFTVWSGEYQNGVTDIANLASMPTITPTATFTYTGPIDFLNNLHATSTNNNNSAGQFFGALASNITNFSSPNSAYTSLAAFLSGDQLSTAGEAGSALNTYMRITGVYTSTPGETVTVSHDDGASLYVGNTTVFSSAGPTAEVASTGILPTASSPTDFTLIYVESNGAPADLVMTVPEPSEFLLFGSALALLGLTLRGRRAGQKPV